MIVLASDYVGRKVVEHFVERGDALRFVVTEESDSGGENAAIEAAARSVTPAPRLASWSELTDDSLLDEIAAAEPEIGLLAWWPRILEGKLLTIPRRGWLNLHPGYLPWNRGRGSYFWTLADDIPCGVSLHFIDEDIDTGPVVAQARVPATWEDTGETVYRRCRDALVSLFREAFDDILAGRLNPVPQDRSAGSLHRFSEQARASQIDLDANVTPRRLLNVIRARMSPPNPPAFFEDGGENWSVEVIIRKIEETTR